MSSKLLTRQSRCYCISACLKVRVLSQSHAMRAILADCTCRDGASTSPTGKQFATICCGPGEVRFFGGHGAAFRIAHSLERASKPGDRRAHPDAHSLRRRGKSDERPPNQPSSRSPDHPTMQPASRQSSQTSSHYPRPNTNQTLSPPAEPIARGAVVMLGLIQTARAWAPTCQTNVRPRKLCNLARANPSSSGNLQGSLPQVARLRTFAARRCCHHLSSFVILFVTDVFRHQRR